MLYDDEFSEMYCRKCGIRTIDKSDNPNSELCTQCREEAIHYPIPKWIYLVGVGILLLLAVSFIGFPQNLKTFRLIEGSTQRANKGYVYSTLSELESMLKKAPKKRIAVKMVDIAMAHGYYDYAAYGIDTYLVGEDVSDSEYTRITNYIDKLNCYYNTYDQYEQMISDTSPTSESANRQIINQLKGLLNRPEYLNETLYYYMGYTATDEGERCEYFEKCYELDPTYTDAAAQIANSYRREGDIETAREYLESAYAENRESASVLRSKAVIEMLSGNNEEAVQLAKEAYELNPNEWYVADTYLVAVATNGEVEDAKSMKKEFETDGYEFDEELEQYLDGDCTLEEYYMD